MDMKDIFESGCFSPGWIEQDLQPEIEQMPEQAAPVPRRKELSVLLGELEEIKNNIENLQAKQWYLSRLVQYHERGFSRT